MRRPLALVAAAAATLLTLLAGCDQTNPAAPVPPTSAPSAGAILSPTVYLLRPDQLRGYQRSSQDMLSPAGVASEESQPALEATLRAEGYTTGARSTFAAPAPSPQTPFGQVVSEAAIFTSAVGAQRYLGEEMARRNRSPEGGGVVSPLTDLPTQGTDQLAGLRTSETSGSAPVLGYLALARRGRVVVELFCAGQAAQATHDNFLGLFRPQIALLQQPPELGG